MIGQGHTPAIKRFVNYFVPAGLSEENQQIAVNIVVISLVRTIAAIVFGPLSYYLGDKTEATIILMDFIVACSLPFIVKATKNLSITRHLSAPTFYLTITAICFYQDGIHSTAIPWLTVAPIISLFTSGISISIFWGVISALTATIFYLIDGSSIILPQNPLTQDDLTFLYSMGMSGLILYILGFGIANEVLKNSAMKAMYKMANEDMLTGIHNRRRFFQLSEELFEHHDNLYAVMIDIDKFKSINDTYGHSTGDKVIKKLAHTISAMLNKDDIFGRLGGEEFAIICNLYDEQGIQLHIENIRKEIEKQEVIADNQDIIRFTISSGIAKKVSDITNVDSLLKKADDALYKAKGAGRNRTIFRI